MSKYTERSFGAGGIRKRKEAYLVTGIWREGKLWVRDRRREREK